MKTRAERMAEVLEDLDAMARRLPGPMADTWRHSAQRFEELGREYRELKEVGGLSQFGAHFLRSDAMEVLEEAVPGFDARRGNGSTFAEVLRRWWHAALSRRTEHFPDNELAPVETPDGSWTWRWGWRGGHVLGLAGEAHVVLAADELGERLSHRPELAAAAARLLISGRVIRS